MGTGSRSRRSYHPKFGPYDKSISPEDLSTSLIHASTSETLHLFMPFKHMFSPCANMWNQTNTNKKRADTIKKYCMIWQIFLFFTTMIQDNQVDVLENGTRVPALIILCGPVPSEIEGDPPVAMHIKLIMQGYNTLHNMESVKDKVSRIYRQAAEAAVLSGNDVKAPSSQEIKAQEITERMRRGVNIVEDWNRFLNENTIGCQQKEGIGIVRHETKTQYRGGGGSKSEPAQQFAYSHMELPEWTRLCSWYSGMWADHDTVNSMPLNRLPTSSSRGNPCNPITVFSLDAFVSMCRRFNAHPAYCDSSNYFQAGSDEVKLPLNGLHYYRLRHTDTRPGHGDIITGKHGMIDTYFPQFPKPSMHLNPSVIDYNLVHGRDINDVDPVCMSELSQFVEEDMFECDSVLKTQMQRRFWEAEQEHKGDPAALYDAVQRLQREAVDAHFSYFHRNGNISDSHVAIIEWFEEFLDRNEGSAYKELPKKSANLSPFEDKLMQINTTFDHIFKTRVLHKELIICLLSAFVVCALTEPMQIHIMAAGPHSTGKSWMFFAILKLLISATVNALQSVSGKSDTDGTNTTSDSVEIREEVDGDWIGMKNQRGGGSNGNSSSRTSTTKANMTSGENTTRRLEWDDVIKRFKMTVYKTILNISYWVAFNGSPQHLIEEPMLDRYIIFNVLADEPDAYRGRRAMDTGDETIEEQKLKNMVYDRFRHNQALITFLGRLLSCGAFRRGIDLTVCNSEFLKLEALMTKDNTGLEPVGARLKTRFQLLCKGLILLNAIYMVYECPASNEKGRQYTPYSLLKCQLYLTGTPEIAAFAFSLLTEQIEPKIVTEILSSMHDTYFNVDKEDEARYPLDGSSPAPAPVPVPVPCTSVSSSSSVERIRPLAPVFGISRSQTVVVSTTSENEEDEEAMLVMGAEEFEREQEEALKARREIDAAKRAKAPSTSSSSEAAAAAAAPAPRKLHSFADMLQGSCAFISAEDPFYIERAYGDDKAFAQPYLRRLGLATAILGVRLGKKGITTDDIEAVNKSLEKRKFMDPRTKKEKPGLLYRTNSVWIARLAFAGLKHSNKLIGYMNDVFDERQALKKEVLLGTMDPSKRAHLHLYSFDESALPPLKRRKLQTTTLNSRYACPASIDILAGFVNEDINDPSSVVAKVYNRDLVTLTDDSLFENCVLNTRVKLGFTDEILAESGLLHPSTRTMVKQVDAYLAKQGKLPKAKYPEQFMDVDKTIEKVTGVLESGNDKSLALERMKSLPPISTDLDRCISEVTRDNSEFDDPLAEVKRTMSLKVKSDALRDTLKRKRDGSIFNNDYDYDSDKENKAPPTTAINFLNALGLAPPRSAIAPITTTTSSSSSSNPNFVRRVRHRPLQQQQQQLDPMSPPSDAMSY